MSTTAFCRTVLRCTAGMLLITPVLVLASATCDGQNRMRAPHKRLSYLVEGKYGAGRNAVIDFYQNTISPVRGDHDCPMHPSCSQYAKQSFDVLTWYHAYTRSMERLLRCGNDLQFYRTIIVDGERRWEDAPIRNDSTENTMHTMAESPSAGKPAHGRKRAEPGTH